jgi:hypothetical protein
MQHKILSLLFFTILIGCKSLPQSALDHSVTEYQNGQWLLSEMWAKKSIEANRSISESQYMMGLCEFKRQHIDVAREWFIKASSSSNQDVQGKATAMLGIISENKGDYAAAESAFATAAIDLQGTDRSEAAKRSSSSSGTQFVSDNTYTLQFGAFKNKTNADSAVTELSPSLINAGINSIWITEDTDRTGRKLYLVQAGHFTSRTAASNRRKHSDLPHCIVTVTD